MENINEKNIILKEFFKNIKYLFLGHVIRSSGSTLRQDLSSEITPEDVENKWHAITDMSNAKHFNSIEVHTIFYYI